MIINCTHKPENIKNDSLFVDKKLIELEKILVKFGIGTELTNKNIHQQ